jgi:hypothetical protein
MIIDIRDIHNLGREYNRAHQNGRGAAGDV